MKRYGIWLLLWCAGSLWAATPEVYRAHGSGHLVIAPDGRVDDVHLNQAFGSEADQVLRGRIQGWRFEPLLEGGKPVRAKARFTITAQIDAGIEGKNYLRIIQVDFLSQPAEKSKQRMINLKEPDYPRDAARAGIGAEFELLLMLDQSGKVLESARDGAWVSGEGRIPQKSTQQEFLSLFLDATDRAVDQWDLAPLATRGVRFVRIPVQFRTKTGKNKSPWRRSYSVAVKRANWLNQPVLPPPTLVTMDGSVGRSDLRLLSPLDETSAP
ncbi:hypothetical protein C7S18_19875 [Ahniella affigens]|uniref:TonB C-terminal domain-containing protein n=1 Tax=Ahniella affigens TaxID=2021234 RepID=A0A2P1PWS4_9GAMM|nr:hypothetical protein [Ahniella affigens]AVP99286.1 hypothetical protein C7S18_19875 [Ahniella affigens]